MDHLFGRIFFYLSLVVVFNCKGEDQQFCRTSFCTFANGLINICCPNKTTLSTDFYTKSIRILNAAKDELDTPGALSSEINQKNHKNVHLFPSECGYFKSIGYRIYYGEDARLNEFPWMVQLFYNTDSKPSFQCGATIINENYVLTAAHCIKNKNLLGVRVGEYNTKYKIDCGLQVDGTRTCTPGTQDLLIEKSIIHPEFNLDNLHNDIALIRVSKKINLMHANSRPVCLPQGDSMDSLLKVVTVTGWGNTETGRQAEILQKAELTVVSFQKCKKFYKTYLSKKLNFKQICASGSKMKRPCVGDSGGPLHALSFFNGATRYVQHGIVSFGYRNCLRYPQVYTRVAFYMDWILDNLKP